MNYYDSSKDNSTDTPLTLSKNIISTKILPTCNLERINLCTELSYYGVPIEPFYFNEYPCTIILKVNNAKYQNVSVNSVRILFFITPDTKFRLINKHNIPQNFSDGIPTCSIFEYDFEYTRKVLINIIKI